MLIIFHSNPLYVRLINAYAKNDKTLTDKTQKVLYIFLTNLALDSFVHFYVKKFTK